MSNRRRSSSIGVTLKAKIEFALQMRNLVPGPQILVDYLPHIIEILNIKPQDRNSDEITLLEKAFSHYKFFDVYTTKKKYREANIMAKCCRNFTIEVKRKGDIIFKERDYADRMYFVLSGKIKVFHSKTFLEVVENKEKFRQTQTSYNPEFISRQLSVYDPGADGERSSPQKRPAASHYYYKEALDPDIPFATDPRYNIFFDEGVLTIKYLGFVLAGEVCGELALTNRKPRTATLIASDDCVLAAFHKKHYDDILFDLENDRITRMMEFFTQTFGIQFNREEASKLTNIFTKKKMSINGYFFKGGEKADGFYIVKKGEISLFNVNKYGKSSSDAKDTVEKKIKEYDDQKHPFNKVAEDKSKVSYPIQKVLPGQMFGEECLVKFQNRFYDAKATSATVTAYYCTQSKLHRFFLTSPEVYDTICKKATNWTEFRTQRLENGSDYYTLLLKKTIKSVRPESHIINRRQTNTIDPFIFITESGKRSSSPSPGKENKEKRATSVCMDSSTVDYKLRDDNKARKRGANVIRSYIPREGVNISNIEYIVKHNQEILKKIAKKSIHSTADFNPMTGDVLFRKFDKRVLLRDRMYIYKAEEEDYLLNRRHKSVPAKKKSLSPQKNTPEKAQLPPSSADPKKILRKRINLLSNSSRRFDGISTARVSTAADFANTDRTDRDPLEGSMTIRMIVPSREAPVETKPGSPGDRFFTTETDLSFRGPSNITTYMIKPMFRSQSRGETRMSKHSSRSREDFQSMAIFGNMNQKKEEDESGFKVENIVLKTEAAGEQSPDLSLEKGSNVRSFTQLLFYPTNTKQPETTKDVHHTLQSKIENRRPDKATVEKLKIKLLRKKDWKGYTSLMKEKDNETYVKIFEKLSSMANLKNKQNLSPTVEPTMKVMVKSRHGMFRIKEKEVADMSTQPTIMFQTIRESKEDIKTDNSVKVTNL